MFEQFYDSCFKVSVKQLQHVHHLILSFCKLSFSMKIDIFISLHKPSNFGLCPGHLDCFITRLWHCLNLLENGDIFILADNLPSKFHTVNFYPSFVGYGFNVSSVFEALKCHSTTGYVPYLAVSLGSGKFDVLISSVLKILC